MNRLLVTLTISILMLPGLAGAHHCKGKHANDSGCDTGGGGGGGGDPEADPAFVYVKPANGSNRLLLANADGSAATEIFTGTKFSFTQQPALYGGAAGGKVLVNDFSNLHLITYSVNDGSISIDSNVKIQDRDNGPTTHTSNPDWSPDGSDFAYRTPGGNVFLGSRADFQSNSYMVDFGDPLYAEDRAGSRFISGVAWDSADKVHLTMENPAEGGWELRSVNLSDCDTTCNSTATTCIAATIISNSCSDAVILGAERLRHVSVSHDTSCIGAPPPPRILVSGEDANGDPLTFVLDSSMPVLEIQNFEGNDWTPNCTIVGSPGDGASGPLNGGAIVEFDPYNGGTTTLIGRKGQWPDWMN